MTQDAGRDGRPPFFMVYRDAFERICAAEPASLRPYMLTAYCCIANHINGRHEEDGAFPSYGTIARETGISRASAIRAVRQLEASGLLTVTERQDAHGDRTSNLYTLTFLARVVSDSDHPAEVVSSSDHGGIPEQPRVVSDSNPNKNQDEEESEDKEVSPVVLRIRERDAKRQMPRR